MKKWIPRTEPSEKSREPSQTRQQRRTKKSLDLARSLLLRHSQGTTPQELAVRKSLEELIVLYERRMEDYRRTQDAPAPSEEAEPVPDEVGLTQEELARFLAAQESAQRAWEQEQELSEKGDRLHARWREDDLTAGDMSFSLYAWHARHFFDQGYIIPAAAMQGRTHEFINAARATPFRNRTLHSELATALLYKGLLEWLEKQSGEAIRSLSQSIECTEACLAEYMADHHEGSACMELEGLRACEDDIYTVLSRCLDQEAPRTLALAMTLLRKGRVIDMLSEQTQVLDRTGASPAMEGEIESRMAERQRVQDQLLHATFLPGSHSDAGTSPASPARRAALLRSVKRLDASLAALVSVSAPRAARQTPPGPGDIVPEVTKRLRGRALLEFVCFEPRRLPPHPGKPRREPARYLALVLLPEGQVAAADLGPAEPIERAVADFRHALANPGDEAPPRGVDPTSAGYAGRPSYEQHGRRVYDLVMAPVVPLLGGCRDLLLSPVAALNELPFAALHDGTSFLLEEYRMCHLNSGRDLLREDAKVSPGQAVILLADPQIPELDALPHARSEAEQISDQFPKERVQAFFGEAATKERLLQSRGARILHVATHGFFQAGAAAPSRSSAATRGEDTDTPERVEIPISKHPMLRAGLFMATPAEMQAEDNSRMAGMASALEIAGMDLSGTELVILSTCRSGATTAQSRSGVYGLRRAIQAAGAQTLVTSLWDVDDASTMQLMVEYYRQLRSGQDRVDAMHKAMRKVRLQHPHPYYWAPFIVLGTDGPLDG